MKNQKKKIIDYSYQMLIYVPKFRNISHSLM